MQGIGQFLGQLFGPIGTVFHFVFYLPVYNILMVIYQAIGSFFPIGAFAIAIVLLTVLIRCALLPLTRRQLQSTRKMQMLQPQLKELQARYRSEPQRLMKEQQALYRENGVSMYGGCLPLLVQMPFLYALFFSFNTLLRTDSANELASHHLLRINADLYPFVPHLLHLPITQFFWTNLANPDPYHILPVLAGALTFFQLRMAMPYRKKVPGQQQDVMTQSTQTTQYIMPFVTIFIGWAVPSGLALYWVVSTGFSALQQYFLSGWGSFWVGIPGMEHLVKEQTLPTATVKPASGSPARALVPTSTTPPAEGGISGWWNRLRETATTMTEERVREREEASQKSSNGASANGTSATNGNGANRDRRERRLREGPVLVKATQPAPDAVDAAIAAATSQADLPEAEIARAASGTPKAANGSSNGNGASNGNGNGASNGTASLATSNGNTRTVSNGTTRPAANGNGRVNNQQRKGSGKGSSGSRPRGGRKGGR